MYLLGCFFVCSQYKKNKNDSKLDLTKELLEAVRSSQEMNHKTVNAIIGQFGNENSETKKTQNLGTYGGVNNQSTMSTDYSRIKK